MDEILSRLEEVEELAEQNSNTINTVIEAVQGMKEVLNAMNEVILEKIPAMESEMESIRSKMTNLNYTLSLKR